MRTLEEEATAVGLDRVRCVMSFDAHSLSLLRGGRHVLERAPSITSAELLAHGVQRVLKRNDGMPYHTMRHRVKRDNSVIAFVKARW